MAINDTQISASIIIPHYNDVVRLDRCLASLMANDLSEVEIVVVDNGSDQSLDEIRAKYENVRFVAEGEKGAAAARNRGVAETSGAYLYFIDADCVAADDWVETARRVRTDADMIGGRVDVFDETPPPRSGAEGFETVFAFNCQSYIEQKGFSVTANLITRRDVFEAVGPFKAGVSEDNDWCWRARDKGYSLIYVDALAVSHPSRSDWDALRRKWQRLTNESYLLFQKNRPGVLGRASWIGRACLMPLSAVVHIPKVLRSPRLQGAREYCATVATLFRLRLLRMFWMLRQALGLPV
ncbi:MULTISPECIES: glycosyltransferase family 2 protein [unclassified Ruegeria]|uniref:glycosyltransferase family 2 protein n=1 Tax=unclassified Ruegeria TaxID=2625375 RepID=UPI001487C2EB|nr:MULTISPECIES: glycosyltransferase [unclassified Ruegeria]